MKALFYTARPYIVIAIVFTLLMLGVEFLLGGVNFFNALILIFGAIVARPVTRYLRVRIQGPLAATEFPLSHNRSIMTRRGEMSSSDNAEVQELEERIQELRMLGQFSEALNFTVNFDAILWLVYTNCQGVLDNCHFYIYLTDVETQQLYTAFSIKDDQRMHEREGITHVVTDRRVLQVIEIGLVHQHQDEDGRYWIIAPLNAGANSVGALHASHKELDTPFAKAQEDILLLLATRTATAINDWQTNLQLQRRAQQLESLNEVIRSINSETELQPLLNLILEKAIELLNVEAGSFMLRDEDTGELEFVVVHGPASKDLLGTRLPAGKGVAGQVAQTGQPILVNNVQNTRQWFSQVDESTEFHTRSMLTVPLVHQRSVLGVLQVVNRRNGAPFVEMDKMLLTAFAGEAAVTLENARLLQQTDEELQSRVRELTLMQNLDRDLNRTLDLNSSLDLTASWLTRLFDATAAGLIIFDREGNLLANAQNGSKNKFELSRYARSADFPSPIGQVLRSGEPLLISGAADGAMYQVNSAGVRSQMIIPIVHEQHTIGVAAIESNRENAYSHYDLDAAVRLVDHVTVAIANSLLYAEVHSANMAKSEFVSIVSHELKTPLTAIRGYTDLMLAGLTGEISPQQREYMSTIVTNVSRMMDLIKDLTDISRIDTGQLHVNLEPLPFANVVSDTITSVQSLADSKQISIHLDMPTNLPLVMGDHQRLVQVLTNLLSNACKYSPPNTDVQVSIERSFNEKNEPIVWCSVKDSGYGISEEDQAKLFTKFFRSNDPNVRLSSGTGLGLFITKGIIELHGGELTFDSQLGKGTTFAFSIVEATSNELVTP